MPARVIANDHPESAESWEQGTTPSQSPCAHSCSMIAGEQGTRLCAKTLHTNIHSYNQSALIDSHVLFVRSGCSLCPNVNSAASHRSPRKPGKGRSAYPERHKLPHNHCSRARWSRKILARGRRLKPLACRHREQRQEGKGSAR